jgi:hypothetical protein
MDFVVKGDEVLRTAFATIGNTVVIEAGDVLEANTGLIVKGTATGAKLAYSPKAHASGGGTQIEVTVGNAFVLQGSGDAVFAQADCGTAADLVVDTGAQQIDVSASSTNVFIVCMSQPDAVVGAKTYINVVIALPLF